MNKECPVCELMNTEEGRGVAKNLEAAKQIIADYKCL